MRRRLAREIGVALALKAAALLALYLLFFSPAHRPPVAPSGVAEQVFAPLERSVR